MKKKIMGKGALCWIFFFFLLKQQNCRRSLCQEFIHLGQALISAFFSQGSTPKINMFDFLPYVFFFLFLFFYLPKGVKCMQDINKLKYRYKYVLVFIVKGTKEMKYSQGIRNKQCILYVLYHYIYSLQGLLVCKFRYLKMLFIQD